MKTEHLKKSLGKILLEEFKKQFNKLEDKGLEGRDLLIGCVFSKRTDIAKFLIEQGTKPDARDVENDWTSLHYCVDVCNIEMLKFLIEAGANVNVKDKDGNTALFKSLFKRNTCPEIIKVLLNSNADINQKNNAGNSSQNLAARFKIDLTNF